MVQHTRQQPGETTDLPPHRILRETVTNRNSESPVFCYFLNQIAENYQRLVAALPPGSKLLYSLKANSHPAVVSHLVRLGAGCDVASPAELSISLKAGVPSALICYGGPGKTEQEVREALECPVGMISVESVDEAHLAARLRRSPETRILARLANRDTGTAFGIEEHDILQVIDIVDGVHSYDRSQILSVDEISRQFLHTRDRVQRIFSSLPSKLTCINFGGGFGIPYFREERALELRSFRIPVDHSSTPPAAMTEVFESGRYLVGNAGFYLAKVLYKKRIGERSIAVVNGGAFHFMAATKMGQLLHRPFPIHRLDDTQSPSHSREPERVMIVGKSCSPLDVFAPDVDLPRLDIGDWIVIGNAGAYGAQYSPTHFIGFTPADELVFNETNELL